MSAKTRFDLVEAMLDRRPVDVVEEMWGNVHQLFCLSFAPTVSDFGIVYCKACGSTVGSLNDPSDSYCPRCDCFNSSHHHQSGNCLCCGQACGIVLGE